MQRHEVRNVRALIELFRSNHEFSSEWRAIWSDIAETEGGKISLTTAGTILGAVLGGVGIAAMGGAIALPLALVLELTRFRGYLITWDHRQDLSTEAMRARLGSIVPLIGGFPEEP
jgi:hypothetical protein